MSAIGFYYLFYYYHVVLTLSQDICHGLNWWLLQSMNAAGDPLCRQSFHARLFVQLFWCHNQRLTFIFSHTGVLRKNEFYLAIWELKFSIYRQINLTKLANFRFHNERSRFHDERQKCVATVGWLCVSGRGVRVSGELRTIYNSHTNSAETVTAFCSLTR